MTMVNGIENPLVCIPANGVPITFNLDDGASYPVQPSTDPRCADGWTVPINWDAHLEATEMWAVNDIGESAHVPIAVPEISVVFGLAVAVVFIACILLIRK